MNRGVDEYINQKHESTKSTPVNLSIQITNGNVYNMVDNNKKDIDPQQSDSYILYFHKFVYNNLILCQISKMGHINIDSSVEYTRYHTFNISINSEVYNTMMTLLARFKYKLTNTKNIFKLDLNSYKISKIIKQIHSLLEVIKYE